jgi:hypothetical protein
MTIAVSKIALFCGALKLNKLQTNIEQLNSTLSTPPSPRRRTVCQMSEGSGSVTCEVTLTQNLDDDDLYFAPYSSRFTYTSCIRSLLQVSC